MNVGIETIADIIRRFNNAFCSFCFSALALSSMVASLTRLTLKDRLRDVMEAKIVRIVRSGTIGVYVSASRG